MAPTRTFSSTVIPPNGLSFWKVRPTPGAAGLVGAEPGDGDAVEPDVTGVRSQEAGQQIE
jgi:hypothetical protein